jgi:hypothetical protein
LITVYAIAASIASVDAEMAPRAPDANAVAAKRTPSNDAIGVAPRFATSARAARNPARAAVAMRAYEDDDLGGEIRDPADASREGRQVVERGRRDYSQVDAGHRRGERGDDERDQRRDELSHGARVRTSGEQGGSRPLRARHSAFSVVADSLNWVSIGRSKTNNNNVPISLCALDFRSVTSPVLSIWLTRPFL